MQGYLSNEIKVTQVQAALADGQTDPDSASVDMQGFDGVLFIGSVATISAGGTVKMQVEQSANDSDFAALSGMSAQADDAADSDKLLMVDVFQPTDRYLRTALTRGTANSVYNGTVAIQYKARSKPTTQTAASLAASLVQGATPAEA